MEEEDIIKTVASIHLSMGLMIGLMIYANENR